MFLFKIGRLPDALGRLFHFWVAVIPITPDNAFLLHTPLQNKYQQFALCFQGRKFFNSSNTEIQNVGTLSLFKSKLRTLLLSWLPFSSSFSPFYLFIYFIIIIFFWLFSRCLRATPCKYRPKCGKAQTVKIALLLHTGRL